MTNHPKNPVPNHDAQAEALKAAIEKALLAHPAVRQAVLDDDPGRGFVAYVVPDDAYMDEVLGRAAVGSALVGKWRKIFDLSQLNKAAVARPVGFNTEGWNSSYTRGPISLDDMKEWVENCVGDILRLKPRIVCEIGCGTGMLVLRIAPRCDRYVAVDQSSAVLERLREQLRAVPKVAARVEVVEGQAAQLTSFSQDTFDTVVLNSVVQLFPNVAYLTSVLENAINLVKPGGHVYVGDVRSLPLLPVFATSVELFQAAEELSALELRDRIRRRIEREPELALSPAYFLSLPRRFPKVSRVDIRPLRGRADNEMTRFRYEAILHIGDDNAPVFDGEFFDWTGRNWTVEDLRSLLRQYSKQPFGIRGIRNARLEKGLAAMAILDGAEGGLTSGAIRQKLEHDTDHGIHPQALFELENENFGFKVFLSWVACRNDGSYDAFFLPKESLQGITLPVINWPEPDASAFLHNANAPGQGKMRKELTDQLMAHCTQNLPPESVPREIILVDSLEHAS